MTGRKYFFINIIPSLKNKVKFENNNNLSPEGIGDVLIRRKDDKQLVISKVLYIPNMKSNLLSISQLVERNYKVFIENRMMRVIDLSNRLILKAHMSRNRTFRIELDVLEHKCLAAAAGRDEWLWHYILGHLNFNDISNLKRKTMVSDLPKSIFQKKYVKNMFKQRNIRITLARI